MARRPCAERSRGAGTVSVGRSSRIQTDASLAVDLLCFISRCRRSGVFKSQLTTVRQAPPPARVGTVFLSRPAVLAWSSRFLLLFRSRGLFCSSVTAILVHSLATSLLPSVWPSLNFNWSRTLLPGLPLEPAPSTTSGPSSHSSAAPPARLATVGGQSGCLLCSGTRSLLIYIMQSPFRSSKQNSNPPVSTWFFCSPDTFVVIVLLPLILFYFCHVVLTCVIFVCALSLCVFEMYHDHYDDYHHQRNWTINTTFKRRSRLLLLQLRSRCGGAKYAEHSFWLSVAMANSHIGPPLLSAGQSEAALEPQTFSVTSGATGSRSSGGEPAGGAWVALAPFLPPTRSVVRGDYSCTAHSNCFDTFHARFL